MTESAILLANGRLRTVYAKTAHGLIRGPSRYALVAVVDATCAGSDAGEVLDGVRRGIPVVPSARAYLDAGGSPPDACVIGVATGGGVLPEALRDDLIAAASAGIDLVNGLHQPLADDPQIAAAAREGGAEILDLRRPRPVSELRFWTGEVLDVKPPRVAILGTDCAVGKRTAMVALRDALARRGLRVQVVATGQTGWLQGFDHGFILDATPNDFVCGELERAVLEAADDGDPHAILIEGQSSLRNPSGPCGAEFLLAAGARTVVLQHSPRRRFFEGLEERGIEIPPLAGEIELIRAYGAEVVAVGLHTEGMDAEEAERERDRTEAELGIPCVLPLRGGMDRVADRLRDSLGVAP